MKIKYDVEKLKKIVNDLSTLTGISMDILDGTYNALCVSNKVCLYCRELQRRMKGNSKCYNSDHQLIEKSKISRRFEHHICFGGLYDAVMPVIKGDRIVATIVMGQIKTEHSPKEAYGGDDKMLQELYDKIPFFSQEQIESLKSFLPNILFDSAISIEFDNRIEQMTEFIENNLGRSLSIEELCKEFTVSKNTLYEIFREQYSCTVNEYITAKKIKQAKTLLRETNEPVYKIAETIGVENYTYFSKLFRKEMGMSPVEYRKKHMILSVIDE